MTAYTNLEPGDVVQLNPELDTFGGCFMIVSELKSFGAQGYVRVPGGGDAFYRVKSADMEYIGRAVWVREDQEPA